jgi:hypothetical protein
VQKTCKHRIGTVNGNASRPLPLLACLMNPAANAKQRPSLWLCLLIVWSSGLALAQQGTVITPETPVPGIAVTRDGPQVSMSFALLPTARLGKAPRPEGAREASVFLVTTTNDTGDGSFRKALLDANANPGTDIIDFNIPGLGPQTIFPMSKLPNITDPVLIDGSSQPGYAGTPLIVLDGTDFTGFDMLDVFANDCVIRGLAIDHVRAGTGIVLYGDDNSIVGNYFGLEANGTSASVIDYNGVIVLGAFNRVGGTQAQNRNVFAGTTSPAVAFNGSGAVRGVAEGNYFGTDASGTVKLGTQSESVLVINGATDDTIGGTVSGSGNVCSGSAFASGISIVGPGTRRIVVQGNSIGTDANGMQPFGNAGNGVYISGADSTVIGALSLFGGNLICGNGGSKYPAIFVDSTASRTYILGNSIGIGSNGLTGIPNYEGVYLKSGGNLVDGNVISGNTLHGVIIRNQDSPGNILHGNRIGVALLGGVLIGNSGHGILVNGSDNVIGGTGEGEANIIADNFGAGVSVESGQRNHITGNAIFANYGLGIDLAPGGVNPNDTLDADVGANEMQNYPGLDSLKRFAQFSEVWGTLMTAPMRSFTVEFFADSMGDLSGYGQGMRYLGSTQVSTGADGMAAFDVQLPSPVSLSEVVTSTATDDSGNTSEFSRGIGRRIVVTDPARGVLWIVGEQDTIHWHNVDTGQVQIDYSVDDGKHYKNIVSSVDAQPGTYFWTVPKEFSAKSRIRVRDLRDTTLDGVSERFKIKGWILTKYAPDSSFIAYDPRNDGWSFANDSVHMWPQPWFSRFDYADSLDPYTGAGYPLFWPYFLLAKPADFPDWPLFVYTFGTNACYHSQFSNPPLYKISSVLIWALIKGAWLGSCYGLAITSILAFDDPSAFMTLSGVGSFGTLFQVGLTDHLREVINSVFWGQVGKTAKANDAAHANDPPSMTLSLIKSMFASDRRDDQAISFDYKAGFFSSRMGHEVVPYRIESDSINPSMEYIYVYDNNYPGDTTTRFEVNTATDRWSYPRYGWSGSNRMWLSDPASDYLLQPVLSVRKNQPRSPAITGAFTSPVSIFASRSDKFLITDSQGGMVGLEDTSFVNTIPGANLILARSLTPAPPLGYDLPAGTYSMASSHNLDTTATYGVVTDSAIYMYERSDGSTTTVDHLWFDGGLLLRNDNAVADSLRITGLKYQSGQEQFCQISGVSAGSGDSLRLLMRPDRSIDFMTTGGAQSVDLRLGNLAQAGGTLFSHANVASAGRALMRIVPSWEDLVSVPVKILIDHGMHGSFDDSVEIVNQLTAVMPGRTGSTAPQGFMLWQNYPNPFNPKTVISGQWAVTSDVRLEVYDVLGRKVATLADGRYPAGKYSFTFDGTNLASGVYFYRLTAGHFVATKAMVLEK